MRYRTAKALAIGAALALALALVACGDEGGASGAEAESGGVKLTQSTKATLVLDFLPGPPHVGIYDGLERGTYAENNVDLDVVSPTSTSDPFKFVTSGRADFGIVEGLDLAQAIDRGEDVQGIMAILQAPQLSLIGNGLESPADLEGKDVGVTGGAADPVIVDALVRNAGADPSKVKEVTIGFNGVQNAENGKVAAFVGFKGNDGLQLEAAIGDRARIFPVDENGGPRYPGLVVFAKRSTLEQSPALFDAFVDSTIKGYRATIADPAAGFANFLERNDGIKREGAEPSFEALRADFGTADTFGRFVRGDLEALSTFLADGKVIDAPVAPDRYAAARFIAR